MCAPWVRGSSPLLLTHAVTHTKETCIPTRARCTQNTRERLDTLSNVVRTLGEGRQQANERMDSLERQMRASEASANTKIYDLNNTMNREWS